MDPQPNQHAVDLLKEDPTLQVLWDAPPQAVMMPFAKEQGRSYLTVIVFVIDQAMSFDVLASICARVIEVLASHGVLETLGGLEIMPCIVKEGNTKRILRLSVLDHALVRAERISPDDLKSANPANGITCYIYEKDLQ